MPRHAGIAQEMLREEQDVGTNERQREVQVAEEKGTKDKNRKQKASKEAKDLKVKKEKQPKKN